MKLIQDFHDDTLKYFTISIITIDISNNITITISINIS